jgi:hypothetical protein
MRFPRVVHIIRFPIRLVSLGRTFLMNPLTRLWQWYRDRRIERRLLKGHDVGEPNRPKGTTPIVGIAEDARLRWLIKSGRR